MSIPINYYFQKHIVASPENGQEKRKRSQKCVYTHRYLIRQDSKSILVNSLI